jgi:hypothetical protein
MRNGMYVSILAVILAYVMLACGMPHPASVPRCSVGEFLDLTYDRQRSEIRLCSPSRQVDLYMRTMERTHPPRIGLADIVAKSGSEVVPALLEEMKYRTSSASQIESVVFLFLRMKQLGTYDASGDPLILEEISSAVESIHEPQSRAICDDMLEAIRDPRRS